MADSTACDSPTSHMNGLRQRSSAATSENKESGAPQPPPPQSDSSAPRKNNVLGRTPDGRLFHVQETPDMLSSILRPDLPKTPLDLFTLFTLGVQITIFFTLSREHARIFFLIYFAFWRISYNAGLGYLLYKQSKTQWLVQLVDKRGWLDPKRCPSTCAWLSQQLTTKMGKTYQVKDMPIEYNTWLLFRSVVDVILLNDFTAYLLFGLSNLHGLRDMGVFLFVVRWMAGWLLILFNIWVKVDAHRVVKDYAWYWGDCFFLCLQSLVFDGVYEVAPDPMYSIGYAGYYGLSLLTGSYTVLFVSLAAHASQLMFLVFFENPHMDRVYGERRPIAARISQKRNEMAQESTSPSRPTMSTSNSHDLHHRLFRSDAVIFSNLDMLRASDFLLVVLCMYAIFPLVLCNVSSNVGRILLCCNALGWRVYHTFALGAALRAQSQNAWIVRHFLKFYHFINTRDAVYEAFEQWKTIYNTSLVMVYISYTILAIRCYTPIDQALPAGTGLLRYVLGVLLIGLHLWSARSSYRVLGPFGWLYGDFFIQDYPHRLSYTGIYRFLNNPERTMGGAAFFGLALLSGSPLLFAVALFSTMSHWWFLSFVEEPHMRKLYGEEVRAESSLTKQMKLVAQRNAYLFKSASGSATVNEVQDTLRRTQSQAKQAVGTFISHQRPNVERIVGNTEALFIKQCDRLLSKRTGDEIRTLDRTKYSVELVDSPNTHTNRYHLGESISVRWTAPRNHSRRDWIGMYPIAAFDKEPSGRDDAGLLVTHVSSRGKWIGIAEQEWVGDHHSGKQRGPLGTAGASDVNHDADQIEGISVFQGTKLPWHTGRYELRYHHDGSHDVLAMSHPFEIVVDRPNDPLSYSDTYASLAKIVRFALADSPRPDQNAETYHSEDPDDLVLWHHDQARHIANGIKDAFAVDFSPKVVVADANIASLASNIVAARQLMCTRVS
ncbi:phosphatidylethanolamine N-methyltransferase [Malassezia yamatoensis]|uniref:Phosphatidylethanolamine N-methyltransferase n=1 Tax=Malassezia yamatoensis TaxID=253288 RepID=A0AAJ5YNZ8_9BASI|nr:phosphatidylethanolamine N-methyltransferase [Malassezia yamatoensis]